MGITCIKLKTVMVSSLQYLILEHFVDGKRMMKLMDTNGKLKKIQNIDGDVAGKVIGNAWKRLVEKDRQHYESRVFQLKLNIFNSDEGKEALRRMCIDELCELQHVIHFQLND